MSHTHPSPLYGGGGWGRGFAPSPVTTPNSQQPHGRPLSCWIHGTTTSSRLYLLYVQLKCAVSESSRRVRAQHIYRITENRTVLTNGFFGNSFVSQDWRKSENEKKWKRAVVRRLVDILLFGFLASLFLRFFWKSTKSGRSGMYCVFHMIYLVTDDRKTFQRPQRNVNIPSLMRIRRCRPCLVEWR